MKTNPKDFLLNTDYELDKIVLVKTGLIDVFHTSETIPHNLKFTPLIFGIWSTDSDFTQSNTIGRNEIGISDPNSSYSRALKVDGKSYTDHVLLTETGQNASSQRAYYRLYALIPHNNYSKAPATSKKAHSFILNTDYNYRKLLKAGEFTQSGQTFEHNLGYVPQVMAWIKYKDTSPLFPEISDALVPLDYSSSYNNGLTFCSTPSEISVEWTSPYIEKIIWRVYYDEA